MTAPVTVRVTPSQGPFCEDNFTISFFIPFAVQVGSGECVCVFPGGRRVEHSVCVCVGGGGVNSVQSGARSSAAPHSRWNNMATVVASFPDQTQSMA